MSAVREAASSLGPEGPLFSWLLPDRLRHRAGRLLYALFVYPLALLVVPLVSGVLLAVLLVVWTTVGWLWQATPYVFGLWLAAMVVWLLLGIAAGAVWLASPDKSCTIQMPVAGALRPQQTVRTLGWRATS